MCAWKECKLIVKGLVHPKMKMVINYSHSCRSKPVTLFNNSSSLSYHLLPFRRISQCIRTLSSKRKKCWLCSCERFAPHPQCKQCWLRWLCSWVLSKMDITRGRIVKRNILFPFCFAKLKLSHWCHMNCFTDALTTFLDLGTLQLHFCLWEGQRALWFNQKHLNLCSDDEWRSTWGWVINDRIFLLGWPIPLKWISVGLCWNTVS